jgi:hypothetical protein
MQVLTHACVQVQIDNIVSLSAHGFDQENLNSISTNLDNLSALERVLPSDEAKDICKNCQNLLQDICMDLHKRAVIEMTKYVQTKGSALISDFRSSWLSHVDVHENALVVQKAGQQKLKKQLEQYPPYLELWEKYFQSTTNTHTQVWK